MALRLYQREIIKALIDGEDYAGNDVVIRTNIIGITNVYYYGNKVATIYYREKRAEFNNCGFDNACTTARINAVKLACDKMGFKY